MNLDNTCTQQAFADLVGIGQPAVSDMLARGVIQPGQTARQWILDSFTHLREQAAGRGADGELAANRAKESFTRNQLLERKLKRDREETTEVEVLEVVFSSVGRTIVAILEPLANTLHKRIPTLSPEDLKFIQGEVSKACDRAASASLAMLTVDDEAAAEVTEDVPFVEEEGL